MGIYIKGMQKPDHCLRCPMKDDDDDCVLQLPDQYDNWGLQMEKCPLIPVPDHGRLIDADAFREEMDKHYPFDKFTQSKHGEADAAKGTIIMMLANAPTIIPAD